MRLRLILCLLFTLNSISNCLYSQTTEWGSAIKKWEKEIRQQEERLSHLEQELREAEAKRDRLIRDGFTDDDENLMGENALRSVERDIEYIKGSIDSCKGYIEQMKNNISNAREKERTLNREITRRVNDAMQKKTRKTAPPKKQSNKNGQQSQQQKTDPAVQAQNQEREEAERQSEIARKLREEKEFQERTERGNVAAAEASREGAAKTLQRTNKNRKNANILQENIQQANPNGIMSEQRKQLGNNFQKVQKENKSSSRQKAPMSEILSKTKAGNNTEDINNLKNEIADLQRISKYLEQFQ